MGILESRIRDLGARVELVPMDSQFRDISIGLYENNDKEGTSFVVHTYSPRTGASDRMMRISSRMAALGGMDHDDADPSRVRFPCGCGHRWACRRIFLEAVKADEKSSLEANPLEVFDAKCDQTIEALADGDGNYSLQVQGGTKGHESRASVAALGLVKLGQMEMVDEAGNVVAFECNMSHDAAVGLLLSKALNVRSAIREIEERENRGVLAAPTSQSV